MVRNTYVVMAYVVVAHTVVAGNTMSASIFLSFPITSAVLPVPADPVSITGRRSLMRPSSCERIAVVSAVGT